MLSSLGVALVSLGLFFGPQTPLGASAPTRLAVPATPIRLQAQAEVAGPIVRLGDLATVHSGQQVLAAIPLGAAPLAGLTRVVTRSQVRAALRAHGHDLSVTGSAQVVVTRPRRRQANLSGRLLGRLAKRFIRRELGLGGDEALVLRSELPARWRVPSRAASRLQVLWAGSAKPTPGSTYLEVVLEVSAGETTLASMPLTFERTHSASAPQRVVSGAAPRRTAPQRTAPRRTAPRRTAPQRTAPQRTAPQRTWHKRSSSRPTRRTPVRSARPRVSAPESSEELIKRGQHVTVVVRSGGLTITAEGTAEKGGPRGGSIPVRLGKDRPLVVGRIVSAGRVVVELRSEGGE